MTLLVDEAGDLEPFAPDGHSRWFLIGVVVTGDIEDLERSLCDIERSAGHSLFLARHLSQIESVGFHATSTHWDLYNHMLSKFYNLNFRAHFILVDKESDRHMSISKRYNSKDEIYDYYLKTLLRDRLIKYSGYHVNIVLEQNLANPSPEMLKKRGDDLELGLESVVDGLRKKGEDFNEFCFSVNLGDKSTTSLHVVDFMNSVVIRYFNGQSANNLKESEKNNFLSLSHKIGSIYLYAKNEYILPRKKNS